MRFIGKSKRSLENMIYQFNHLPIPPMHQVAPPNKDPAVPEGQIASGFDLAKNLIAPTPHFVKQPNARSISSGGSSPVSSVGIIIMNNNRKSGCPVMMGIKGPDIII